MAAAVNTVELENGVRVESLDAEDDCCEECGADTSGVTGDGWWPDQDGIYVACPECGHVTHHPNAVALDDDEEE